MTERQHRLDDTKSTPEPAAPARRSTAGMHADLLRLQQTAGNRAVVALLNQTAEARGGPAPDGVAEGLAAERGRGRALDPGTRDTMERAIGADLGHVRVHSGERPTALNRKLSSRAFTVGDDIFFRGPVPSSDDAGGRHVLAHEVAHTLQRSDRHTVRRLYVESDEATKQGTLAVEGGQIHYKWDATADQDELEDTGHKVSWYGFKYPLYRPKVAKKPTAKGGAAAAAAATPAPKAKPKLELSAADVRDLTALQEKLTGWATLSDKVDKHTRELRKSLAAEVKKALAGTVNRAASSILEEATQLEASYAAAAEKLKTDKEAKAAEEAKQKKAAEDAAALEALIKKNKAVCGDRYPEISRQVPSASDLDAILAMTSATTLLTLLSSFTSDIILSLLMGENQADRGAKLLEIRANVAKKAHPTELLKETNRISVAQLRTLLDDTSTNDLIDIAPRVKSGKVLLKLRASSTDSAAFAKNVTMLLGAGWDPTAAHTAAESTDATAFDTDLLDQRTRNGLVGHNGVGIDWMSETAIHGDGLVGEQDAVTNALRELDAGHRTVAGITFDRGKHENKKPHHLPGAKGVLPYREWGIMQPHGNEMGGARRLVIDETEADPKKRRVYYTWTHYGEVGSPAFVKLR